ncbi:hypothetical protein QC762_0026740 [Podospora pseudocomata]|uniref:Uncharacterized protein n=1 Tax=Podospora pseudocomata TaxID=2093779 RepID=A0ABR0GRC7_9PEZI|nr:hypothetical protein QC762_0026740 [Podospora pseudocomata]
MITYCLISDQFITKFAYEEYQTPTALGQSLMVVPRASAVVPAQTNAEPVAIHANHHNMVKYTSREDSGYKTVLRHLKDMANDAIKQIPQRWEAEKRSNEGRQS